jgi:hypothetical protein
MNSSWACKFKITNCLQTIDKRSSSGHRLRHLTLSVPKSSSHTRMSLNEIIKQLWEPQNNIHTLECPESYNKTMPNPRKRPKWDTRNCQSSEAYDSCNWCGWRPRARKWWHVLRFTIHWPVCSQRELTYYSVRRTALGPVFQMKLLANDGNMS